MPFGLFKGITADVRLLEEKEYVKNEKERTVPLSINPFREPHEMTQAGQTQSAEESERPSEWLELAGDLAWTTSFSSLTSSTAITEPIGICNYAVFFALTWHLWATQITYDIKYYTNDWWHHGLFFSQLVIYGLLAAFSSSFNVGWHLSSATMNPFICESTALADEAIHENEVNSMKRGFIGVNFVLFASRILLLSQYLRVIIYRRKSNPLMSRRFYLQPLSVLVAACIFLGCALMIQKAEGGKAVAVTQLTLWGLAIFVQFLAAAMTPKDKENALKSRGEVSPRLSGLTVIIIGEGLNGMCYTMRHTLNVIGIMPWAVEPPIILLFVFYLFWILYFDGFWISNLSRVPLQELWLWLHFPLHLCLILMFEGIKNLYISDNIKTVFTTLLGAIEDVVYDLNENGILPEHPKLETLLLPMGISWKQEIHDWNELLSNTNDSYVLTAQMVKWTMACAHSVHLLFNDESDPEAECKYNDYISQNDTVLAQTIKDGTISEASWILRYSELLESSQVWLLPVSGALLLCLALLNVIQRRPRNRFAWGYSLNRAAFGAILILIKICGGVPPVSVQYMIKLIPYIVACFFWGRTVDWLIHKFSMRSIRAQEEAPILPGFNAPSGGRAWGVHEGGDDVMNELPRPPEWPWVGGPLTKQDAVGTPSSVALPYEAGGTDPLDGKSDPNASVPGFPIPRL